MKTILIAVCLLIFTQQGTATLKPNDLDMLTGNKWMGSLTYLDYTSNMTKKIPVEIAISAKSAGVYTWATVYPQEVARSTTEDVAISADGKTLRKENVQARTLKADGSLEIITHAAGKDNDKPATFRFTYTIGKKLYVCKKEVCYFGENTFFTRNQYVLTR